MRKTFTKRTVPISPAQKRPNSFQSFAEPLKDSRPTNTQSIPKKETQDLNKTEYSQVPCQTPTPDMEAEEIGTIEDRARESRYHPQHDYYYYDYYWAIQKVCHQPRGERGQAK